MRQSKLFTIKIDILRYVSTVSVKHPWLNTRNNSYRTTNNQSNFEVNGVKTGTMAPVKTESDHYGYI